MDVTTDILYSQDIQQLEPNEDHMSWLPQKKLKVEKKEVIQESKQRKAALLGKYNKQIKDLETTHETWIGNFRTQHKKRLQKCPELYASKQQMIDKAVISTDELQAYVIIRQVLDTFKKTNVKVNSLVD